MWRRSATVLLTCWLWLAAGSGSAHDPGLSELTLSHGALGVRLEWVLGDAELPRELDASSALALTLDGRTLPLRARSRRYDATHTALTGSLAPLTAGELQVKLELLSQLPRGHRVFARTLDSEGKLLTRELLGSANPVLQSTLKAPSIAQLSSIAAASLALIALPFILQWRERRRRLRVRNGGDRFDQNFRRFGRSRAADD